MDVREEQSDSKSQLASLVPHAEVERDSREERAFQTTEEESTNEETGVVLDEALEGLDESPGDGDDGEEARGTELLEDQI
jgi:hypothetical protein